MEFSEVLKARRSIRKFTSEGVTAEQIMTLLDAAVAAPYACNLQSWHFYVVTDASVKARLSETKTVADWATTAPVIFIVCTAAKELRETIREVEKNMKEAAKQLDFERAAELRDVLFELRASSRAK
jgi:nitroreductase